MEQLQTLINKHEISAAYLAKRMDMPRGTFNNKLKHNRGSDFSGLECTKLLCILAEMEQDLGKFRAIA